MLMSTTSRSALALAFLVAVPGLVVAQRADDDGPDSNGYDLDCEEFDRYEVLTPNDTLSVLTKNHNPQQEQGYLYAYAVDDFGQGVGFDHLIGQTLVVSGLETIEYSVNAVDYRAMVEEGALTDVDADGVRDLNGVEYEKTAGEVLVPRFLGQTQSTRGKLVLVGLSGGVEFTTTANFLVYNDDEDQFSAQYTFRCWAKPRIKDVSTLFRNSWLQDFSGDDPNKSLGNYEYGWFRVFGANAHSTFFDLLDPAVYAVYVEALGGVAAADLPFERCLQSGHLLPRLLSGDNEELPGSSSDQDCEASRPHRQKASLLLYPEFDNRAGVRTVVTTTNTSAVDEARVHYIYVGRYGAL